MRNFYHLILAFLGSLVYGEPSKKITVVGITGTKGKSLTLQILDSILEVAGYKTALLSSVWMKVGERREKNPFSNTMPGRGLVQKFLKKAVLASCEIALVEVTSEGVVQNRHRFIDWDAAIFLNIHPEHIEAHGGFENYREAKLKFFRDLRHSAKPKKYLVVNGDDENCAYFAAEAGSVPGGEVRIFHRREAKPLVKRIKEEKNPDWLSASFVLEDVAAAAKTAEALGVSTEKIIEGLNNFRGLRGRLDFIQRKPFVVVVDYAHTPDSLRAVYEALRRKTSKIKSHRLICVLGSAGGGRDKWKRPELGTLAAEYCEKIFITDEDPYDEDPEKIIEEVYSGIPENKKKKARIVLDRREAIKEALGAAKKDDIVVLTGKGSEDSIHVRGGKKIPWDERRIVEEILKNGR